LVLDLSLYSWLKWTGEEYSGGFHHLQFKEIKTQSERDRLREMQAQAVV